MAASPDPPALAVAVDHAIAGHPEPIHATELQPVVVSHTAPFVHRRRRWRHNVALDLCQHMSYRSLVVCHGGAEAD